MFVWSQHHCHLVKGCTYDNVIVILEVLEPEKDAAVDDSRELKHFIEHQPHPVVVPVEDFMLTKGKWSGGFHANNG